MARRPDADILLALATLRVADIAGPWEESRGEAVRVHPITRCVIGSVEARATVSGELEYQARIYIDRDVLVGWFSSPHEGYVALDKILRQRGFLLLKTGPEGLMVDQKAGC